MKTRNALATLAITAAVSATARGDVVFGDFESGSAAGWGWLTGDARGIVPWDPSLGPAAGTVVAAPSGPLAGSNILKMTGTPAFNYGQGGGAVVAFDMVPQGFRSAFLEHDQIEFDWYAPPDPNSSSGWSQIWNVILNSEGGGFTNVDGYSQNNPGGNPPVDKSHFNQFYFTGFNGSLKHVVVNYSAYKNAVLASGFPDGGRWLQLGMQLNPGGGAPAEMWFDNFKFSVAPNNWNLNDNGNWSEGANWSPATAPNAAGKVANFGAVITEARTVTVDAPHTVGRINFNNDNKYTIGGTATVTLDGASGAGITVSNGSHEISAPLALAKDVNVVVASADDTLTVGNLQPSSVGISKSGPGVLAVNNVRANSLAVNEGTLVVLPDSTAAGTSNVAALSIGENGRLDLKNNKLVTNSSVGTWDGTKYTGIQGEVARAYDFGAWDLPGIMTSEPDAGPTVGKTTIGVATGEQALFLAPTDTGVFAGQTISGTTAIAMYTWAGDVDLNGYVDAVDYGTIDQWIQFPGTTGYTNGDLNYDGVIDAVDYGIIDNGIQLQGAPIPVNGDVGVAAASAGLTAVPEPASAMVLVTGALAMLGRRHRRRS